jgi:hypothetical protein
VSTLEVEEEKVERQQTAEWAGDVFPENASRIDIESTDELSAVTY